MTQKLGLIMLLVCFPLVLSLASCQKEEIELPPAESTEQTTEEEELFRTGPFFNQRYCEVLAAKFDLQAGISLEVFNTVGCNSCPEEEWNALDADSLQDEMGSLYVRMNGPRHWLMDSISSSTISNDCGHTIGGIEMSQVATIPISLNDIPTEIAYQVSTVERNNAWHFFRGRQVYILQDPFGSCFIMQSFSQKVDPDLELEDLATLDMRLNLPDDWSFKTLILEEDFVLETQNGMAELVSDELENAYQYLHGGCF